MAKHLSESRTEDIARELLDIQGWEISRPPKGHVIRKNEYKDYAPLARLFTGASKSGIGDGYPDFLTIDKATQQPQLIIETKASPHDLDLAVAEAKGYGDACRKNGGLSVLVAGVAGQEKTGIKVEVYGYYDNAWQPVLYRDIPISWLPTPSDVAKSLSAAGKIDLTPIVPRPEILLARAENINRLLREASIKDEYRPAYIGAIMLAMWTSQGNIERNNPAIVLNQINQYCEAAFEKSGRSELASSLRVDTANTKLANSAWQILSTLEKLNVLGGAVDHDYLGQLYELFFRYTGGNTIGQYFTPRHITRFMADMCETSKYDRVIDPACGTGGFLIACIQRAYDELNLKYEDVVALIKDKLVGYEAEPVTAALCIVNMILRGDGQTGIHKADSLRDDEFPIGQFQVALMNPPFPHKQTDALPQEFVERALQALDIRGLLAVILPTSVLVKRENGDWRAKILENHTLVAVCQLPDELFQPYASATTSIVMLRKGIPHSKNRKSVFVRLKDDGLTLKKGVRVHRADGKNDIPAAVEAITNPSEKPGFSGLAALDRTDEWSVGAYIPSGTADENELRANIDDLLRRFVSFYTRYAKEVVRLRLKVKSGEIQTMPYRAMLSRQRLDNAIQLTQQPGTIGERFTIYYGQKQLHSRDGIPEGDSLIVSPTEQYNGCYGWLDFQPLLQAPFVTVAQTGSIGEAFVQMEPCGVNDDCLVLLPRSENLPMETYFITAAVIRAERWRFTYGRKLTPARIFEFKLPDSADLYLWTAAEIQRWQTVIDMTLALYSPVELP